MRTNTDSHYSIPWAQFDIEISSHNLYALLTGAKIHAHQHDALMVDRYLCCFGPFADVLFSVIDSFSPFLVKLEVQLRVRSLNLPAPMIKNLLT